MHHHDSARSARRSIRLATLGVLLLALASPPAWPAYAGFLSGTPMGQLDQKDIDALNSTVLVVLNTKNDGETTPWMRPATVDRAEVSATLTPEGTSIKHRRACRFVAVTVHTGNQTVTLRPQYCQSAKMIWELQGAK
ncbi:hypothetical protein [Paraburkholderia pallida]|uniref:hypothetical protein n=1 Tax=Paraburkholderia pallida TaxID=2547399 RepID=UPI0014303833|nr:hypothetical protein [Paraburkholderia pallida]